MQPASLFARIGQGINQACASLHEAGTRLADAAADQVGRAVACCRRPARPRPPVGPAAHEVAPPLRDRDVDLLPAPPEGNTPEAQRLRRLHGYLEETRVAIANDPDQAFARVLAGFHLTLTDVGLPPPLEPAVPVPGQMNDAPAANDNGEFARPRSDL